MSRPSPDDPRAQAFKKTSDGAKHCGTTSRHGTDSSRTGKTSRSALRRVIPRPEPSNAADSCRNTRALPTPPKLLFTRNTSKRSNIAAPVPTAPTAKIQRLFSDILVGTHLGTSRSENPIRGSSDIT